MPWKVPKDYAKMFKNVNLLFLSFLWLVSTFLLVFDNRRSPYRFTVFNFYEIVWAICKHSSPYVLFGIHDLGCTLKHTLSQQRFTNDWMLLFTHALNRVFNFVILPLDDAQQQFSPYFSITPHSSSSSLLSNYLYHCITIF